MGHINTIGSLDRTLSPKVVRMGGGAAGEMACRSMATLNRLTPYGGEAPPPYEWTLSVSMEDVVSLQQTNEQPACQQSESFMLLLFPGARSRGAPGGEGARAEADEKKPG